MWRGAGRQSASLNLNIYRHAARLPSQPLAAYLHPAKLMETGNVAMKVKLSMAVFGGMALIAAAVASPQTSEADYMVLGVGNDSCGKRTEMHAVRGWDNAQDQWVMGYITAHNAVGTSKGNDIAAGTDFSGLRAWLNRWCSDNPLENIADAAAELVIELRTRQGWWARHAPAPPVP